LKLRYVEKTLVVSKITRVKKKPQFDSRIGLTSYNVAQRWLRLWSGAWWEGVFSGAFFFFRRPLCKHSLSPSCRIGGNQFLWHLAVFLRRVARATKLKIGVFMKQMSRASVLFAEPLRFSTLS